MRRIIFFVTSIALAACTAVQTPKKGGMSAKDLGHGFSIRVLAQEVHGGFESMGYFSHCFYQNEDLGQCDHMFPAPSGKFAIYQQASSGLVFFFNTKSHKSSQVTSQFQGLLNSATWQEKQERVDFLVGEPGSVHPLYFMYHAALDGS